MGWTDALSGIQVKDLSFTSPCLMAIDTGGEIHSLFQGENCAGYPDDPHYKHGTYGLETPPPGNDWQTVSGGELHACALDSKGRLTCWGLIDEEDMPDPSLRFVQVDSANHVSCGVTTDSHLVCWGAIDKYIPSDVPTTDGWVQVAVSKERACALDTAGQVHCFGDWPAAWPTLQDALRAE